MTLLVSSNGLSSLLASRCNLPRAAVFGCCPPPVAFVFFEEDRISVSIRSGWDGRPKKTPPQKRATLPSDRLPIPGDILEGALRLGEGDKQEFFVVLLGNLAFLRHHYTHSTCLSESSFSEIFYTAFARLAATGVAFSYLCRDGLETAERMCVPAVGTRTCVADHQSSSTEHRVYTRVYAVTR